jgi:hypothetical protein
MASFQEHRLVPMSQEKLTIHIHARNLKLSALRIIDNEEQEIPFKKKRILPRLWKYQRSELETLIDGPAKSNLRISASTARWFIRDAVKNPLFILSSLMNSYQLILEKSGRFSLPLRITTIWHSDKIWISRNVIRNGIAPTNLDESLEYDRLRNPGNYNLLVTFAENETGIASYELFERESYELYAPGISESNVYFTDYEIFEDARVKHGKIATQQAKLIQISNRRFELVRRSPGWVESKGERFQILKPHSNVGVVNQAIFFGSSLNWFHFIVECLTRFVPIPLDLVRGTPVILESGAHDNIRQLCVLLTGVPPIVLKPGEEISVRKMIIGREFGVLDSIDTKTRKVQLIAIRERVLSSCSEIGQAPVQRIYLRRPLRLFRPLQNEKKIVEMLSRQGFVSIFPEKESIQRLVQLLNSAEVVVVESGAAMTNLMFANKAVKVLELNPGDGGFGFWHRFLEIFEIESTGIVGNRQILGRKGLAVDGYRIPIEKIELALSEMLAKDRP